MFWIILIAIIVLIVLFKKVLKATLHLDKWNEKLPEYKKDFIKKKIKILELELKRGDRSDHDER